MPGILNYFGLGASAPPKDEETTSVRTLPASWYTSQDMFGLERRAIFSKKWLLITHKVRFAQAGDWLRYEVAGFPFVLCRDREGKINGFHNICRHRAYPVVEGEKGTAKIFACRYHGWSYGLNGKLAKAPGYQELDGFDKSKNSLFPIHVHIDKQGFVWVNLDGRPEAEIAWSDDFDDYEQQEKYKGLNMDEYVFDHTWEQNGKYNWKILADKIQDGHIQHGGATTSEQRAEGLDVRASYYFPNASVNFSPNFFFLQRFEPKAPQESKMSYEVFRHKNATDEDFQLIDSLYKQKMSEDKDLCELSQRNLNTGVFINGEMHPNMEEGPLFFQSSCRDLVMQHRRIEQASRQEIWPARQVLPDTNKGAISQKDIDFCSGLACAPTTQTALSW